MGCMWIYNGDLSHFLCFLLFALTLRVCGCPNGKFGHHREISDKTHHFSRTVAQLFQNLA